MRTRTVAFVADLVRVGADTVDHRLIEEVVGWRPLPLPLMLLPAKRPDGHGIVGKIDDVWRDDDGWVRCRGVVDADRRLRRALKRGELVLGGDCGSNPAEAEMDGDTLVRLRMRAEIWGATLIPRASAAWPDMRLILTRIGKRKVTQ